MEEPRKGLHWLGNRRLLSASVLCCALATPLFALEVDAVVSAFEVNVGESVIVDLIVRSEDPSRVSVDLGPAPTGFRPGFTRKERRLLQQDGLFGAGGSSRIEATQVSLEWIATVAGSASLGPFRVTVAEDEAVVPAIAVQVLAPIETRKSALRWSFPAGPYRTGERVRLSLEGALVGSVGPVSCPAPENALLEAIPLIAGSSTGSEPGWQILARYDWTPLQSGPLSLPVAVVSVGGAKGESRPLSTEPATVTVERGPSHKPGSRTVMTRALGAAFAPPADVSADEVGAASGSRLDSAQAAASTERVARLRELRSAEYRRLFPGRYRAERLALEREAALTRSMGVPLAAWKPVAVIASVLAFSAAFVVFLFLGRRRGGRSLSAFCLCAAVGLAIFAVTLYTRDLHPAGVCLGTRLLHVPDPVSSVLEEVEPGTALPVLKRAGQWLYTETPSGVHGWIPAASLLVYTADGERLR